MNPPQDTPRFKLWSHLQTEHKLTLLESELDEIIDKARAVAPAAQAALARSREQGEEDTAILDWMGIETKFHYTYFRHGEYCAGGISYIPSFAFPIGQKAPPHMTLRELARASMKAAQTPPAARHPEERK